MEGGGSIFNVGSFRASGSSSIWRNDGQDVFSRCTSMREDDEEALKWAAIERLPTFDRLRKGLIVAGGADCHEREEVDISKLGMEERKRLLERLVRVAEEDNERFLLKLRDRMDRVGLDIPTIEVRFQNLSVSAEIYVGSRAIPNLVNFSINMIQEFLGALHVLPKRKKNLPILHNVCGIIKPRRMTLLLGPPSSGKTTLLLALAGKLDSDLKVSGRVTYNGHGMKEFVPQRSSAYISQHDLHIPEMTVRETLDFSARCQGVGTRYDMLKELLRREKEANIKPDPDIDIFMKATSIQGQSENVAVDYMLRILGLDICADTLVGNEIFRGISGGQKKRVTTGEMLVGPARALFMDEISNGLDSSTTYRIVNCLRQAVHALSETVVVSLLQPPPETYDLFDDIILLSDGWIVYQGPRESVLDFFEHMGFRCPERKGVADFLQEVTSRKDQAQYSAHKDKRYNRFITDKEFAEAFKSFHIGQRLEDEMNIPFDKDKSHPAALTTSRYGTGKKELLKACFDREVMLMKRNSFVYIFKTVQLITLGIIAMTLFLRTDMHKDTFYDGGVYLGALYFGLTTIMFNGFSELSMTIAKLPVFYKQRDLLFFPAWAYSLPTWITKIPVSFIEATVWVLTTYYVVGYDSSPERMFKQILLLIAVNQMASGLFRLIASVGRDLIVANTFGSFALLIIMVLGGFIMSRDDVRKWWIWGYWSSPLMYGQNAIAVNEFLGKSWQKVLPKSNIPLGVAVMKARGIFPHAYWYWLGFGALWGYTLLFNGLFTISLAYLKPFGKSQTIISKEELSEKNSQINGENVTVQGSSTEINTDRIVNRGAVASASRYSMPDHSDAGLEESRRKGMVLPFTPLSITFGDIRYSVDMPPEMKAHGFTQDKLELLKGVSGAFRPGVLTALMGVTGAGKTTLMDVLAGRKTGGYITGSIKISGYPKRQETFARIAGYCEQNDIHSPHLTVQESLLYSGWLRLPPEVDSSTRQLFVAEIMELVELTSIREALIGLPGVSGLSLEQRKRLTIAVELVANPSIIFMDEPTSGLDARSAAIVMRTVRNTVDTGRTVVCTIHQPSIDIFESFTELFLLKQGGEEIYVGPLGDHCCELIKYFEAVEGVKKIKERYNPAAWMLEVTSHAQEQVLDVDFAKIYKESDLFKRNKALIRELSSPPPGRKDLHFRTKYSQPFHSQLFACLWKQHRSYWRNPSYTAVRFFFTILSGLVFGAIFWQLGSKRSKQQDLFNVMGSVYAAILFIGINNGTAVLPVISVERTVFYRERAAGMYSALPYALAQVLIEVPYVLIQAILYTVIVYPMIGYEWTTVKFFWFLFFMYMAFLYFTYYGMMTVALTPNYHVAYIISTAFYAIWNIFSGFIFPRPRMPIWWRWYYWACPVSWSLYGQLASQFGDVHSFLEDTMPTPVTVADFLKIYFGFRYDFLNVVSVAISGFAVLFALTFTFAITKMNFERR